VEGDWPSPGFDGGFLPVKRTVSAQGFTGEWSIPFIARGIPAEGTSTAVSALDHTALGISFVEVADPYQSVSRSVKYALLFIGLLFLSYFVFEATAGKRVHPAQYVLVGVAHMISYLLLLSLAERIGFDWGFLVAGGATVLLLSANAKWIFASRVQGLRALFVFTLLYFFIYLLLRLEDNALLVGAVASFLAVAAVMYFTRNIDWYSSIPAGGARPSAAVQKDAVSASKNWGTPDSPGFPVEIIAAFSPRRIFSFKKGRLEPAGFEPTSAAWMERGVPDWEAPEHVLLLGSAALPALR
jgi:inner membrane protein